MKIAELSDIKGIGEKRIQKLKSIGIFTPIDLVSLFPYKYIDTTVQPNFDNLEDGDEVAFLGSVVEQPKPVFVKKGLNIVKCDFKAGERIITCSWFNFRYIAKQLEKDKEFYVVGKVKRFHKKINISVPTLYKNRADIPKIIPLYKVGIPVNIFTEAVGEVLNDTEINGFLPQTIRNQFNLYPLGQSFREVHQPQSIFSAKTARYSIALENLSYTISAFSLLKKLNNNTRVRKYINKRDKINSFIDSLPFKLTDDQLKTIDQILTDLMSDRRMNRLLQGDVGCGKTVVVFITMYFAALNGFQSVLIAPTELLASQHYATAIDLFKSTTLKIEILTGNQTKPQRDNALFNIKFGADIVIGTHALIQDNVEFSNLSYIVIDEQHRFGVNQRAKLENKAYDSDCLTLSATPIPRTLALTLYGDLDISSIKTLPKDKAKIFTKFVPSHKISDMYQYLYNDALLDRRTYIVCPRIDDEEDESLQSANKLYKQLSNGIFKDMVGLLHGNMKECNKAEIMGRFKSGEIKILISTTIIEVGIDVTQAVNIVIFNAERYGLSQLHQMRGRVGRGAIDSYCFLLSATVNEVSKTRIDNMLMCNDGFTLAEMDFEARGAGDFIGTRQHGDSYASSIKVTIDLINSAKAVSDAIMGNSQTVASIMRSINDDNAEFIKCVTLN